MQNEPREIKKGYGVIVGRFQTPYLHDGHRYVIDQVLEKHENLIICLGIQAGQPSDKNPLDFESRKIMILENYPLATILPLKDMKSDLLWSKQLDKLVGDVSNIHPVTLYGSRDSFIPFYNGKYETKELKDPEIIWSSTIIREEVVQRARNSQDFRAGVIYGITNRIPSPYSTVDVAIVQDGKLLLAQKPNEDGWRFVGGYVDNKDENYEMAAKREALEEAGRSLELSDFRYVMSARVNDWRYKKTREKVFTTLFVCKCVFGNAEAGDDVRYIKWVPFEELHKETIEEEHKPLMHEFMSYLSNHTRATM